MAKEEVKKSRGQGKRMGMMGGRSDYVRISRRCVEVTVLSRRSHSKQSPAILREEEGLDARSNSFTQQ